MGNVRYNPYVIHIENEAHLYSEFRLVGSTEAGNRIMLNKGRGFVIRIDQVSLKAANVLKQEMLARGGDAAVHRDVAGLTAGDSSIVLMGTKRQFLEVIDKLRIQPFGLKQLSVELAEVLNRFEAKRPQRLTFANDRFTWEFGTRTLIMGILNVTPDSFSDGGSWTDLDRAVQHAQEMIAAGADILDIGGESTRPGHAPVAAEEEMQRVIPIIERLSKELAIPISIDTYKSDVAKAAIEAGAHIVNDVWGFKKDPEMARVCAELDCPVILMHNRETPYEHDVITGVVRDIRESIALAREAGVREENIILDPGIGFGKTHEQNLYLMKRMDDFKGLGYPVLLGTSRKSMIGNALDLPVTERVEGTAATVALGIAKGVDIVRVHDVKEMARVARMTDAMVR
ncbi:dihydropteroate synthase [Tumebacillus algifaecis]|uniref:dihydropteroate synthase n=1 Tax=Tumebacillus algifaecis TaxID=1214604 RepID=UPI001D130D61|nr:dihydropteroate synthase [Tumebacillus algifaecis]